MSPPRDRSLRRRRSLARSVRRHLHGPLGVPLRAPSSSLYARWNVEATRRVAEEQPRLPLVVQHQRPVHRARPRRSPPPRPDRPRPVPAPRASRPPAPPASPGRTRASPGTPVGRGPPAPPAGARARASPRSRSGRGSRHRRLYSTAGRPSGRRGAPRASGGRGAGGPPRRRRPAPSGRRSSRPPSRCQRAASQRSPWPLSSRWPGRRRGVPNRPAQSSSAPAGDPARTRGPSTWSARAESWASWQRSEVSVAATHLLIRCCPAGLCGR